MTIRVALIDDHPIVLSGLERLFEAHPDIQLVGQALNADDGLKMVRASQPDILVLDLKMPGTGGLELLRALNGDLRRTRVGC